MASLQSEQIPISKTERAPRILVFDSGLGGLTVLSEIVRLHPTACYLYAADDAVFPYGSLGEADLVDRVTALMEHLIPRHRPDIVVIACNTASVSVLPPLRRQWPVVPFVGTVPAIKPAAALSQTRAISVLATPGTVAREYTRDLVRSFADGCDVTLVGAPRLATLAEAALRGLGVSDDDILAEMAPAFVERNGRRTDAIVLACTHYPLLLDRLKALAPWPVTFIDSAPAIARRTDAVLETHGFNSRDAQAAPLLGHEAVFTAERGPSVALRHALASRGFSLIRSLGTLQQQPA